MTTEAGAYTLNGEAFASGTDVMAEANGSTYTLTLDGSTWNAAYKMPDAMSLALGTTGGMISVERLEDGSYQANGSAIANGTVIAAENGNEYTVKISEDGMFTAEYVQPSALSIPLGISGSSVEVRRNEDLTFSAMIDGEWVMITAETTVSAENGNLYAAVLSPEGVPIGVMHVAAMQEVMLGALGGTVTVTQAEDMTWWIGEMAVQTGTVYTAANGNDYVLAQDAEGHWSAMYQQVTVMVTLGPQGAVELVRAEDMTWWIGEMAVDVGSEVHSDNGNRYTLWYTDGVWSARFEPESMMIEGTGLVAMSREADDMYDVGDATLPSSGMGDVTVDGAMYHVWMDDGMLMGARFDAAIDTDTDFVVGPPEEEGMSINMPTLSADDGETTANELRTYLVLTGDDDSGMGMFSVGDLLGSGMASDEGANFVYQAMKAIKEVETDVSALLALDTKPDGLEDILEGQWTKLEAALDTVFGTNSGAETGATSAVRMTAPPEEDILDKIAGVLDALASEDAFVAATAENGGGVFESQALGASAAANAFNRVMWTADATMGMTGSTRYGTAARKTSANATEGSNTSEYGAYSYSTMQQTVRTKDAAAVSLTGIASYSGGTHAVNTSGKVYTGTVELQVRFNANSVSGVVSGLQDSDGMVWQHNFADVDRIVLDDAELRRNAMWNNSGTNAIVFYSANSGLLRPVDGVDNTFAGILLGQGAAAGSEANGAWSIGSPGGSGYLAGGFGVAHVADAARAAPSGDDGSAAAAMLFTTIDQATGTDPDRRVDRGRDADGEAAPLRLAHPGLAGLTRALSPLGEAGAEVLLTAEFDLATLAGNSGAQVTVNGPKWIDGVVTTLTRERDLLSTLQGLDSADTQAAEQAAWRRAQIAVQYNFFGGLMPVKLDDAYTDLESEADAIDLINRALDALSSNAKLEDALDPDGTGIFDHYQTIRDDDGDDDTPAATDVGNFLYYDSVEGRNEVVPTPAFDANGRVLSGQTIAQVRAEREYKVFSAMATTDYTRFGVWQRESTASARRGSEDRFLSGLRTANTYAYSPLDSTNVGTLQNLSFPQGGSATYVGETIALQNTTLLTGTAQVDVSWGTPADVNAGTSVGTMSMTISGLASAAGDPLSQGGNADPAEPNAAGNEIADIVFPGMSIIVGGQGNFANNMVVGAAGDSGS